ncbi:DNA ligase D [Gillisia limnaea]|uniref:DNA ligase (ATP) n=1 Tax=Gillisia limnaea (strain DSM 15749 / LMG 21470 / R-8282) TaxID=865937 RepID=H2BR26_GILLR|nr:DNA ligase D [Gillisia limnaea]EHQ04345.1 ATP-dependent DNA ligase LigD module [Gillisia limnaea DSM 15749]
MALEDYNKKRDFNKTPEPTAEVSHEDAGRFVIQRHKASRLHYDLRLELEGVLKSWAVPKGPSMNPDDKRLAIQTEDHPVKYLTFHGTIPKGNYGAGVMKIWDEGTYRIAPEYKDMDLVKQFENGDLKIEFFGRKIKGTFALVHTKRKEADNHWLLIKKKDNYSTDLGYDAEVFKDDTSAATKKNTPVKKLDPDEFVKPMLASFSKDIFNDKSWVYELKWDGYRVMAHIKDSKVQLYSRNGISYNTKFKALAKDLEGVEHDVILDGEVVIVNDDGIPQFQALQNYDETTSGTLRYYVFDMLFLNGHSMLELTLLERKSLIPDVIENLSYTLYCDHIEGMGAALYKKAIDAGMEGVVAKKIDSTYSPGYRSDNWLKIKAVETEEAIICGYTDSVGGGSIFGSLILGIYIEDQLKYIGNCGSGFSAKDQSELLDQLKELEVENHPFKRKPNLKERNPHWVSPLLICEVKFSEWTKNGIMRHPVFKGIRSDKNVQEVSSPIKKKSKHTTTISKASSTNLNVGGLEVPISNLDKILWPDDGYTKYDLIDYYINISDYIVPYLKDRPQNLYRHPNGIKSAGFYQKNNENLPQWMETEEIFSKSSNKNISYLLCQNEASLLYMANLGCIEINPWHSRINNLDYPDYTIIDLDPSKDNTFEEVITVAQAAKEVLDIARIKGFCKTSGSSGLHIYIPLNAKYTYEEARSFTKLLCYFIEQKVPKLTSMVRAVKDRKGKIYLDYLQNRQGQTIAAPYCVRPKRGAPVSTPLEWKEVKSGLKILDFNIKNFQTRIQEKGDLFTEVLSLEIDMMDSIQRLEK